MTTRLEPTIVQPGMGKDLRAFGHVVSVMLGGDQTGGTLTVMLDVAPPGAGPPPHVHSREDELFLVVDPHDSVGVRALLRALRGGVPGSHRSRHVSHRGDQSRTRHRVRWEGAGLTATAGS
jgi:hypothetical protein